MLIAKALRVNMQGHRCPTACLTRRCKHPVPNRVNIYPSVSVLIALYAMLLIIDVTLHQCCAYDAVADDVILSDLCCALSRKDHLIAMLVRAWQIGCSPHMKGLSRQRPREQYGRHVSGCIDGSPYVHSSAPAG